MNRFIVLLCLLGFCIVDSLSGQSVHYAPTSRASRYVQILDIQDSSSVNFHSGIRNYFRKDATQLAIKNSSENGGTNFRSKYLIKDNVVFAKDHPLNKKGKGIIKGLFYKTESNFFGLQTEGLELYVNPILNISFGNEKQRMIYDFLIREVLKFMDR